MKTATIISVVIGILMAGLQIRTYVIANYEFTNRFLYAWELADKSSTLEAKSNYMNEFVNNLASSRNEFAEYNAVWLKTPDNNFDKNFTAVKTLRDRLVEIKDLDPNSFAYQTAIQQITAQEQGEALDIIYVFKGCWFLESYLIVWDWFTFVYLVGYLILIFWRPTYILFEDL